LKKKLSGGGEHAQKKGVSISRKTTTDYYGKIDTT